MRLRLGLFLCWLVPGPSWALDPIAEAICTDRRDLVQRLEGQYRSHLQGMGLRDPETVMEVWASEAGAWTLVQSHTDGRACILAMGDAWDLAVQPPVAPRP